MAKPLNIFSNWNTMVQGLEVTPSEFYDALEDAIQAKNISNLKNTSVSWSEGGILSAQREYLRVRRKEIAFDICCAPFGNGSFFSWWLGEIPSGFLAFLYEIPFLAWLAYLFEKFFKPDTYYKIDTMMMFQSLVHEAMLEIVDQYANDKGLKPIEGDDRKPKMKDLFDTKS